MIRERMTATTVLAATVCSSPPADADLVLAACEGPDLTGRIDWWTSNR